MKSTATNSAQGQNGKPWSKVTASGPSGGPTGNGATAERAGPAIRKAAIAALSCGLSVVPPKQDGSKAPDGTWELFQSQRPTLDNLHAWYGTQGPAKRTGLGFVCGTVSGNVEVLEFDGQGEAYERFRAAAAALGLGDLVERIESGYLERSPSGGIHWPYRCETIAGNTKLARRFKTPEEFSEADRKAVEAAKAKGREHRPVTVLIETRGEGGYIVVAPSNGNVHPTGKAYELLRGAFDSIAVITPEERQSLWNLARSFDRMPDQTDPREEQARKRSEGDWPDTLTPWDDFNARTSWADLLPDWELAYRQGECEYWRRPGKVRDHSATINRNGSDRLYVFSSSTEFETDKPYSKFAAYTHLNHSGDFKAATKALSEAGYGTFKAWVRVDGQWQRETRQNPCPKGVRIAKPGDPPPGGGGEGTGNGVGDGASSEPPEDVYAGLSDEDLGIVPLASVECRPIKWLWKYRLSMGGLAMMAGDGGIGKSQVLLSIGAAVTTGGAWPDGSGNAPIGDVVIVSAEDRPDETIKPRLKAMGADVSRVTIIKAKFIIRKPGKPPQVHPASFQVLRYWKEVFRRIPGCRLFIVDPLPSYLGRGVNDSKNIEIRNILEPFLDEVIFPTDICMIGNTHLNKSVDAKTPMHRISGSIAYGNLPRNVHFVVRDPENPERRFFKQAKCNNAPDGLPGLAFKVETREITSEAGEPIETAVPVFEAETVQVDLGAAVNGSKSKPRGPDAEKTMALAEWLHDFLMGRPGPTPLGAIFDAAGEKGLIGHKRPEDNKWSSGSVLYEARKRVPSLPDPRAGGRIDDLKAAVGSGGRAVVHWYLAGADSVF